jgi:hypothetical protein
MADEPDKKKGFWSILMSIVTYIAGIVHQFFIAKNREAVQKDREEIRKNEEAKLEIEERNRAEILVEQVKKGDAKTKEDALNELRKKISK